MYGKVSEETDTKIANEVALERAASKARDTTLQTGIDEATKTLTDKLEEAKAALVAKDVALATATAENKASIIAEAELRVAQDTVLQSAIDVTKQDLVDKLSAEASTRANKDAELKGSITTETQARVTAVQSERDARVAAADALEVALKARDDVDAEDAFAANAGGSVAGSAGVSVRKGGRGGATTMGTWTPVWVLILGGTVVTFTPKACESA